MLDEDDVEAITWHQAMDRLKAVANRYADPEQVYAQWLNLVVAHLLSPGPRPELWRLLALCARSVAFDAEHYAPDGDLDPST